MSKDRLRNLVKMKSKEKAFKDLIELKNSHEKVKELNYEKLEMQSYLKSNLFYQDEAKLIFKLRSNMIKVKQNFSRMYKNNMNCRICDDDTEDQKHLLSCVGLKKEDEIVHNEKYSFMFSKRNEEIKEIAIIFKEKLRKLEIIIEENR